MFRSFKIKKIFMCRYCDTAYIRERHEAYETVLRRKTWTR